VDRGDWMSDLAPILLREDGSVVDGQHRLLAIIRSGKALKMLVIHGITDAQVYEQAMNTRPQSAQDRIVRLGGFDVPPRQRQVAACFCRLLLNHRDKRTIDVGTVETINRWRNVLKAVVGLAHPKRRGIHSSGVLAGFAYAVVAQPKSKSQVLGILSKWGTGDGLPKGLRKWRDHLMSATTGRGGSVADINTVQTAALLIRAIAGQCTTMTWQLSPLQLPGYERLSGMLEKAVTADQRARNGKATK